MFGLMFYFCVGYSSFTARTPVDWVRALVDVAFFVELNEAELGFAPVVRVARLVFGGPVDTAAEAFDGCAHDADVFVHELVAEFHEFFW